MAVSSLLRSASNTLKVRTESSIEGVVLRPVAGAFWFSAAAWWRLLDSTGLKEAILRFVVVGVSLFVSAAESVGESMSEGLSLEGLLLRRAPSSREDLDLLWLSPLSMRYKKSAMCDAMKPEGKTMILGGNAYEGEI